MKSNAHLYLPWSVVASKTYPAFSRLQRRSLSRVAKVKTLDGGCQLYCLAAASASSLSKCENIMTDKPAEQEPAVKIEIEASPKGEMESTWGR